MIETVGDLKRLLADADDGARIRFQDPDTGWYMRFKDLGVPDQYEGYGDVVLVVTEHYSEMRDD